MRIGGLDVFPILHPQNAPEVFVDLPGTMTLRTAGEELSHV